MSHEATDLITIDRKRYVELVKAELKLDTLDANGVDNWEYYGEGFLDEDETEAHVLACLRRDEWTKV